MFQKLKLNKDKACYLIYGVLALAVLFPIIIKSGYVFAMDMIFVPHLRWPEIFNIPGAFLYFLNFILPSDVIQKSIFFLILFLSGIGMHRLIPTKSELPKYFAGIFYIFNPFVYSRFLFGHLWILTAYALMPFAVKAIFEFFNKINFRNALKLSFWLILIGYINSHFIILLFLFFGIAFLVHLFKLIVCHSRESGNPVLERNRFHIKFGMTKILYLWKNRKLKKEIFKILKYTILIILIFSIFSSWWIIPFFNADSSQGQFVQETINQEDFNVFQTATDEKYGVLINVAALYGFWGDRMDRYTVPKDIMPYWPILFLIIFSLAVFGAIKSFKKNKFITFTFIIISAVAFILSVGIAYQPFTPVINFLYDKIFIFKGFRESQKFSAILILAYAYFGAVGINSILNNLRIQKFINLKIFLASFFIALPILYSPLMIWGFKGQLYSSNYPQEWFKANEILNEDKGDFKTLFFPWHQYMSFSFVENKIFANPAPNFFDKEIVAGDNMELGEIYTHSPRPISQFVEREILAERNEIKNLGEMLLPFNIKYIILAKEVDWQEYKFLDSQDNMELIYDSEYLKIYQNQNSVVDK